jgi:hypothetical protein
MVEPNSTGTHNMLKQHFRSAAVLCPVNLLSICRTEICDHSKHLTDSQGNFKCRKLYFAINSRETAIDVFDKLLFNYYY